MNLVTYIPTYNFNLRRRYDSTFCLDEYMLSLQLYIIDILNSQKEFEFVVKCLSGGHLSTNIINQYINQLNNPNIKYNDGLLSNILTKTELAIMDYPSSAILECERYKIPTIVICYPELKLRPSPSLSYTQLFQYRDISECSKVINNFLFTTSKKEN